ncbi:branched-chain amino acid transport system II carrier protein [Terrisporobacter mayombei]|uniref:Branched-chain amino acid transport system carrier protein n=1 Tax=Terrisporobacter mayombei TaxID=1541 RepID=A0ABY9Q7A8_9FIRM|nr:branched-chain amino acid transport system II carrier protein [Terrisporobacter mayombei]MCC3868758.1 branched-chain amino acid transport system II carrier protein [Terrisporobacter mayombei]WMT83115.1 Branched-chain amino acid transport system 2 carrier protein [Terrisporobacter mayombei]
MKKNERDLSIGTLFFMGAALFSMHFGSASMTWPMNWGKESGSSVFVAFAGAFLTALLLPLLAYVALVRGNGTYNSLAKNIMPKFGPVFTTMTILLLGPLYAVPRMSASSWDGIVQATGLNTNSKIPIILFSIVFYLITYWFLSGRSDTMDKISKILFPVLVIIVICIIGKGLLTPISTTWAPKSYDNSAFSYGFTGGYATGEILCALVFGIVILNNLKVKGVTPDKMNKNIIKVGILGIGMLTLSHLGHMIIGASTGGISGPTGDLTYVKLYTKVAFLLLGNVGGVLYCIALTIASLTTAVGITAAAAEFFEDVSNKKLSYKKSVIIICVSSTIMGALGLENILAYVGPLLDSMSPPLIILTLYYVLIPNVKNVRFLFAAKCTMIVSFIYGILDAVHTYSYLCGWNLGIFDSFYLKMPLADIKLAWVIGCGIIAVLSYLLCRGKEETFTGSSDAI